MTKANGGARFTTGEAAGILGVAPRTVSKWFDAGLIKGYHLPGSSDRRIPRECLIAFARAGGMTDVLRQLEAPPPPPAIFLGGVPEPLRAQLVPLLPGWDVLAGGVFDAGAFAATHPPVSVAVLDRSLGRAECLCAAVGLYGRGVRVIGLAAEDEGAQAEWVGAGCEDVLRHPADPEALARLVRGES